MPLERPESAYDEQRTEAFSSVLSQILCVGFDIDFLKFGFSLG